METNENIIDVLNSLIQINNDRIEGYERAAKETDDSDLKDLFSKMASKSHMMKSQLSSEVSKRGGKSVEGTTTTGKIFRVWMDFKAALTGKDRKAILSSCEFGEDAAQDTYETSLKTGITLPADIIELIRSQKIQLWQDHNLVKALRDSTIHV